MSETVTDPGRRLQRGLILLRQRRYAEAESYFTESLALSPDDAEALHALALARYHQDGREAAALAAAEQALARDPNHPAIHATRGMILLSLERPRDALAAADTALQLDPEFVYALNVRASALLNQERWADAEQAARAALAVDPDDDTAANQLATALRLQNKMTENREQIGGMLARDPENAVTHATAGWHALQSGDRNKAEQHFLEALRIDPGLEYARDGLMESFRARSPLYRGYLAFALRMAQIPSGTRWAIILGAYFLSRALSKAAAATGSVVLSLLLTAYVLFALWTHFARPIGNLIVMLDRRARLALRTFERVDALVIGLPVIAGFLLLVANLALHHDLIFLPGVLLIGVALPLHYAITNRRPAGIALFAGLAVLILLAVTIVLGAVLGLPVKEEFFSGTLSLAVLAFLAAQILPGIRAVYRAR